MNIVVTGSLGHIGQPLTAELVQKGHTVTVISSNPERREAIEALGATAAIGSLEDAGFLIATFAGADAVFAMVPPNYAMPDQVAYYRQIGTNYARAIRQSGVRRVVHLSSYGADLDKGTGFILGSHHVENTLNELPDVNLTHLRAAYFYYNLYSFVDMINQQGIMGAIYGGDDKLIMVAPSDIAAVAVEELETSGSSAARTRSTIRYVVSDDRTASEVARVLGEAIGKPDLTWVTVSESQTKDALTSSGMPASLVTNLVELGSSIHNGTLREAYDLHQPVVTGKVKIEDFAQDFAAVFKR
ncbi:NmrA family NAD(P)-binding protein [Spirosoma agri]|uniref:NAD(P)H-binding protein n=1 Tax=Spirosoma agri TaxID=1987381 RepID=A0A6M0IKY7_9BACT|nr:NAD(P)H-binding protein [Spirosoma agri]NEU68051.1 NAD(P)H-binding protein [Spirosoma agri]